MLDGSGTKEFTFQQFISALQDCRDALLQYAGSGSQHCSQLSNVAFDLQQRSLELGKMFRQQSMTENLHMRDIVRSLPI